MNSPSCSGTVLSPRLGAAPSYFRARPTQLVTSLTCTAWVASWSRAAQLRWIWHLGQVVSITRAPVSLAWRNFSLWISLEQPLQLTQAVEPQHVEEQVQGVEVEEHGCEEPPNLAISKLGKSPK